MSTRFQLELTMEVRPRDDRGYVEPGGLSIRDVVELGAMGFLELAQVLGRFHELAELVSAEHAGAAGTATP